VWVGAIAIGVGFAAGVIQIGFWIIRPVVIHRHAEVERFTDAKAVRSAHGVLLFPATDDVAVLDAEGKRVGTLRRPVIDHGPVSEPVAVPDDEVWIEAITSDWKWDRGVPNDARVHRDALVYLVDQPRRSRLLAMMDERQQPSWGDDRSQYGGCSVTFTPRKNSATAVRVDLYEGCGCFGWAEYDIVPAGVVMKERGFLNHRDALPTVVNGLLISFGVSLVVGITAMVRSWRFGWRRWGRDPRTVLEGAIESVK